MTSSPMNRNMQPCSRCSGSGIEPDAPPPQALVPWWQLAARPLLSEIRCSATRQYLLPGSTLIIGLQCKYANGHDGQHAADAGIGCGDYFWEVTILKPGTAQGSAD